MVSKRHSQEWTALLCLSAKPRFRKSYFLAALVLSLAVTSRLAAQETVVDLDPAQTQIKFTLGATLHTVHGTFKLKRGTIRFNPHTGLASGLVAVDVTSAKTGIEGRDRKMHREILESQKFPEATFAPAQVTGNIDSSGGSPVEVRGIFRFHGSDHQIIMAIQLAKVNKELNATTHFVIPYQQWGLKNPSTLFLRVSDKVDIYVQAVGRVTSSTQH